MIQKNKKAVKNCKFKISFYFNIYISYVCRYNNYSVGHF